MIARLTMVSHLFVKKTGRSLVFHCAAEPEKSQFLAPPSQCRRATAPPSAPAVNLFLSVAFAMLLLPNAKGLQLLHQLLR